MPSDVDGTETAVFCNKVLDAESRVLCRYLDAVMIKYHEGCFALQMAVVLDSRKMVWTPRDNHTCWLATAL